MQFRGFRSINQKHSGFDIVFFSQFSENYLGENYRGGKKSRRSWSLVCSRILPESLVVDPDRRFVDDMIRRLSGFGL